MKILAIWITKGLFIFVVCIAEWNVCSNLIPFMKDGITYIKIGNLIFANFSGVSSSVIIAEKYRPSIPRTITGLISYNGENNTYVVDCDIEPTGKTTFHYKDTVY